MRLALLLLSLPFALALPACALSPSDASAREWQRAECNRIIDPEARERCLKRIE